LKIAGVKSKFVLRVSCIIALLGTIFRCYCAKFGSCVTASPSVEFLAKSVAFGGIRSQIYGYRNANHFWLQSIKSTSMLSFMHPELFLSYSAHKQTNR